MTDRELRYASARMHAALRRLPVPDPPGRRRPAFIAAAAAAAVILLLGGWALFLREGAEQLDAAGAGGTATLVETTTTSEAVSAETAPPLGDCVPTTPIGGFVPPEPWPAQAPHGEWYGTADLWTDLPADGHRWFDLPVAPGGGLTQKLFWWSRHFDAGEEPEPAMVVTARRLDAAAPEVVDRHATNGRRPDMGRFMIAGIDLPSEGCWEITGSYRGAELSYVAEVG